MELLIIGDSFSADWSIRYDDYPGWPALLSAHYQITNLSQAGVGEYKIYKQLLSVTDLEKYDTVLISHTSPSRVHTRKHPIHSNDRLHKNADLIYADIEYHSNKITNIFNASLNSGVGYYKFHYDTEYYTTIYDLIRAEIYRLLAGKKVVTLINFDLPQSGHDTANIDLRDIVKKYPGKINHLSTTGNELVYKRILNELKNV